MTDTYRVTCPKCGYTTIFVGGRDTGDALNRMRLCKEFRERASKPGGTTEGLSCESLRQAQELAPPLR